MWKRKISNYKCTTYPATLSIQINCYKRLNCILNGQYTYYVVLCNIMP